MNSIEEAAKSIMTTDTFPKYAISKVKYKNFFNTKQRLTQHEMC